MNRVGVDFAGSRAFCSPVDHPVITTPQLHAFVPQDALARGGLFLEPFRRARDMPTSKPQSVDWAPGGLRLPPEPMAPLRPADSLIANTWRFA
jgi:hypothetical protein